MVLAQRFLLLAPAFTFAACTTITDTNHSAGSVAAGSGGGAPPAVHAEPPPQGPASAPDPTAHVTFAVTRFLLGDTDPDGTPDTKDGWKHLGYDIDGRISTAASTDLCKPRDGAPPAEVYPDGDDGIDNAFGRNVLPFFNGVYPGFTTEVQAGVDAGLSTLLITVDGLGAGTDYAPLTARVYAGAPLGHAPAFDGTDAWPVRPASLSDPTDVKSAWAHTETSYLVGDTWVGRFSGVLVLELPRSAGQSIHLPISAPVISMKLDPTHRTAMGGVIAGVVDTDALIAAVAKDVVPFDPVFCTSAGTPQGIVALLGQASDILRSGTQDPAMTCDGVSIGVGFEASRAVLGPVGAPDAPMPPGCEGDAGAPDGG